MKKYLLLLSLFIVGLSSCQKSDVTSQQAAIDDAKIQAYFTSHKITNVTKDPSGMYYQILKAGDATKMPTIASTVQLTYTNNFISGVPFDHIDVTAYKLSTSIKALQIGIPKIGVGGRIVLYIPSALAYGNIDQFSIPANSVLIYTIDLIGIY